RGKIPVYGSTIALIKSLRKKGIKIAVISSSKNCPFILQKTGVDKITDAIVSGDDITRGKPDPQIFTMAAKRIGLNVDECVVFEDAYLGVEAAKNGNFKCIGIDRNNNPRRLEKADIIVKDLKEVDYQKLNKLFAL
ncbi:MAG: HAD-IA family hydrolase, partial [Candidatus Omnitrophota bacterium]